MTYSRPDAAGFGEAKGGRDSARRSHRHCATARRLSAIARPAQRAPDASIRLHSTQVVKCPVHNVSLYCISLLFTHNVLTMSLTFPHFLSLCVSLCLSPTFDDSRDVRPSSQDVLVVETQMETELDDAIAHKQRELKAVLLHQCVFESRAARLELTGITVAMPAK